MKLLNELLKTVNKLFETVNKQPIASSKDLYFGMERYFKQEDVMFNAFRPGHRNDSHLRAGGKSDFQLYGGSRSLSGLRRSHSQESNQKPSKTSLVQFSKSLHQTPVVKQIAHTYQVQLQGQQDKNIGRSLFGFGPNFVVQFSDGEINSLGQVQQSFLSEFASSHQIQTSITIQKINVQGQTATVSFTGKNRTDQWVDNTHTVVLPTVTTSSGQDTWSRTGGSWQLVGEQYFTQNSSTLNPEGVKHKLTPKQVQDYKNAIQEYELSGLVGTLVNQFNLTNTLITMGVPGQPQTIDPDSL